MDGVMTRLGNWWRYFRRYGLVAAIRAGITGYVYRSFRFVVVRTQLAGPPVVDHLGDVVFRPAIPSDLDNLHELERSNRAYVENDNDLLFVACHGDRIVGTRRYSRAVPTASRDGHGLIPRVLELEKGQIWTADAFISPEYRNHGLNAHFGLFTMRYLASRGYTAQVGTIAASNIPALRSSRHRGATPIYYVSYTRFLFYERFGVSTDIPHELVEGLASK
jgi:GNAT superfamily N-acetyltransferase